MALGKKSSTTTGKSIMQNMRVTSESTGISVAEQVDNSTYKDSDSNSDNSPGRQHGDMSDSSVDISLIQKVRTLREICVGCSFALTVIDPGTYNEAVKAVEWRNAISDEIKAIEKNRTWTLCELLSERKAIGVKWVYRSKYKPNGEI